MAFSSLSVSYVKIAYLLQHGQWELLDFGPSVEIDKFNQHVIIPDDPHYVDDYDNFPIDAFTKFISDFGMQSPKRQILTVHNFFGSERSSIAPFVNDRCVRKSHGAAQAISTNKHLH